MKVLGGETLGQMSPPSSREWGENRALAARTLRAPAIVVDEDEDEDDWDPTFYVPALLVVLAANVAALWWLAANTR
jgi:hypothetical protein